MAEPQTQAPELTAPGASTPSPAAADADSADFAAAIAALTTEAAAPAPAAAPVAAPEAVKPAETPAEPPAAKPEPSEDTKAILARMARLEFEAEQAREEAAQLRAGKDSASKWAKIQELKASRNFQQVLVELGVTADELQTMVLEGNKPLDPETVALKKATEELQEFKAQQLHREQAAAQERARQEFKVKELAPKLTDAVAPLGRAVYGDGIVDQVFAVLQQMYREGDKNPSITEAVKTVEDYLGNIKAKLGPSPAAAAPVAAPAVKPVTATLTNAPTTTPAGGVDMDTEEGRWEAAMKTLKGN